MTSENSISLEDLFEVEEFLTPEELEPSPSDITSEDNAQTDITLDDNTFNTSEEDDKGDVKVTEDIDAFKDTTEYNYSEYFNFLKDNNLLSLDDNFEFKGTVESLQEAIEATNKNRDLKVYTSFWDKLPEEWKPALKYALQGGDPLEYMNTFRSKDLENINLDSVDNQKYIIQQYYKQTSNYTDDKINRIVDKLHLVGELESEAKSTLEELKSIEQEQRIKLVEQKELEQAELNKQIEDFRKNINSSIDNNSTIAQPRKSKVKAYLLNSSTINGEESTQFNRHIKDIAQNPEHLSQLADFLLDSYNPKTGFNFNRFKEKEDSQAVNALKKQLDSIGTKAKIDGQSLSRSTQDDFDWEFFLTQT